MLPNIMEQVAAIRARYTTAKCTTHPFRHVIVAENIETHGHGGIWPMVEVCNGALQY